jgi:TolB-like protein/tetratricopeptide (TPR) repeat protein
VRLPSALHRQVTLGRSDARMSDWLEGLRRRKLIQWAAAYAAGAWVLLQVFGFLASSFAWPLGIVRALVVVAVVGFFAVLVLGWYHGEKGRQRVVPAEILALTALGVLAVVLVRSTWLAATVDVSSAPASGPLDPPAEVGSLAVLPFVAPEGDTISRYFGDGLAEELIYALASVDGLRVASRTSSFAVRAGAEDVRAFAGRLGVEAVLEGSVRRVDDQVRVTTQLTDAQSGFVLWTETFQRSLDGVFELQAQIASAVAETLHPAFDGDPMRPVAGRTTSVPAAYDALLKGRFLWNQRTDESITRSLDFFRLAAAADSTYAAAYAGQADAWLTMFDYGLVTYDSAEAQASVAARKALSLDDRLADAHASLGHLALHEWRWQEAEAEFQRAIELDPSYTTAYHWYALALTSVGRAEEAVRAMERATALDPLSTRISADVGMAYHAAGRYTDAIAQEEQVLALNPRHPTAHFIRGISFEQLSQPDSAEAALRVALESGPDDPNLLGALGHLLAQSGRESEAREIVAGLESRDAGGEDTAFFAALVYTALGEVDRAFDGLERAIGRRSGSVRYLKIEPRLDPLRGDARYRPLIRSVGLPF